MRSILFFQSKCFITTDFVRLLGSFISRCWITTTIFWIFCMIDKQKYDELLKELSLLSSSKTDELYLFAQQLNDELVKQLKAPPSVLLKLSKE